MELFKVPKWSLVCAQIKYKKKAASLYGNRFEQNMSGENRKFETENKFEFFFP